MSLYRRIRAAWHPDEYHGWGITRRYFEGWYFKLVSADERYAIAVIPGIAMSKSGARHSFIQVMDGKRCKAHYFRFAASDFRPSERRFELWVGNNFFSAEKIALDLPGLRGEIQFQNIVSWPKMLGAPGIMGWYSFVPFMECNHGVVSLHHTLGGTLALSGDFCPDNTGTQYADFSNGIGYIEKDWGRSFPRAYVWMQTNHFGGTDRSSLMASVAHIPWLGSHFIGFISGFWLDKRLYRFATYTGAKKYLEIKDNSVGLIFRSSQHELRIHAQQAAGTALASPISGEMTGKINESLMANLQIELLENGRRIFEGLGRNAGLEVAGATEVLADRNL
jgi:tocopherol cyclase